MSIMNTCIANLVKPDHEYEFWRNQREIVLEDYLKENPNHRERVAIWEDNGLNNYEILEKLNIINVNPKTKTLTHTL